MSRRAALLGLGCVTVAAAVMTLLVPRIPEWPNYNVFADQRTFLGIPNFMDVVSNVAFLIAGIYGIAVALRGSTFADSRERVPFIVFFLAVALTSIGSAYYHLHPNGARLFWDRLPMSLAFMALFAGVICERIDVRLGLRLLPALLALGVASLLYWRWTQARGIGDVRPYGFVQFYPLLAIGLMLWWFPSQYTRANYYLAAVGFYVAAKLFELSDRLVFGLTGLIGGHALKHMAAAGACLWLARMVTLRRPLGSHTAGAATGQ